MSAVNFKSWFTALCSCRCVSEKKGAKGNCVPAPINRPQDAPPALMMAEGGVPQYTCDICCQEGLTKEDMKTHVLMAHMNGAIVCPFCDLEGTAAEEMNLHVNMEHLNYLSPTMDNTAEMDIDDSSPTSDPSEPQVSSPESSDGIILSNGNDGCSSAASATSKDSDESNDYALEITITEPKSSPKKDLYGSMVPGSPTSCPEQNHKRAKLHLDVPFVHKNVNKTNEVVKRKVESQENRKNQENENENVREHRFLCPLCDWYTSSPGEIMRHVNDVHVDILSPNKNKCQQQHQQPLQQRTDSENNIIDNFEKPSTSSAVFECPICGLHTTSSSSLEVHVNTKHADILSPSGRPASLAISPDSLTEGLCCPVCGMEFCDTNDLAVHVDGHFSGDQTPVSDTMDSLLAQELERREKEALKVQEMKEFEKLQEMYGVTGKGNYQKQAEEDLDRAVIKGQLNVSDYYARKADILQSSAAGIDDGHSCTKGLLGRLKSYYKSCSNSTVCRVWLCSPCDHFASSYGDKGWGCGYRNLQMLLSCLSQNPTFEQVLFNGRAMIPSIPKIQRLIETAWQKGFDLQGCEQLGGKVINTTKWIGATEIVATLSSLKIKCQLVDFHGPAGKDGTHPRLFEWVRDYFRSDGTDFKPPLYLQHQGHSRTITGIEELKDGSLRLLLFDPSCSRKQMQQFLGDIDANLMRCIRRSLHSMRAKQYQIVAVVDILPDQEYEESKMLKSERIH